LFWGVCDCALQHWNTMCFEQVAGLIFKKIHG
jgi:hypothetical protein